MDILNIVMHPYVGLPLIGFFFGYVLGSIPFGLVLTRLAGYGDIRKIGSGNIGATNVLRTGNKPLALATLILDGGKGAIAVLIVSSMFAFIPAMMAGLGAVFGHLFPVWLKFKGGKGVATTFGTLLVMMPAVGVLTCLTWLASAFFFRISSLAALIAALAIPVYAFLTYGMLGVWAAMVMMVLIWVKHIPNIKRIANGTEPKIGKK